MAFKIAATVVTFNRLDLLKKLVDSLRNQSVSIDKIIVINNSSTDGTEEWLNLQSDLLVVKQDNTGSSGGQCTALKTACQLGYDLIWAMDDDVEPTKTCLQNLLKNYQENIILFPIRKSVDGTLFLNETKIINLNNPFKSLWKDIINQNDTTKDLIEVDGPTFEGPLLSRNIIERMGLPEHDFFIFADDTEYFLRTKLYGYKNIIVTSAVLNRQLPVPKDHISFTWKHYYVIRNLIAIDIIHGNLFVRLLRPFGYLIKFLLRSKSIDNIFTTLRAFKDGYFYKYKKNKF